MKPLLTLLCCSITVFLFSCGKNDTPDTDSHSGRLSSVIFKYGLNVDKMVIYYDDQNRVDSMITTPNAYDPASPPIRNSFGFRFTYQGNNTLPSKALYTLGDDHRQYIEHTIAYDAANRIQEDKVYAFVYDPSAPQLESRDTVQFHYAGNLMYHEERCEGCPIGALPYIDTFQIENDNTVKWTSFDAANNTTEVFAYKFDNGLNPFYSLNVASSFFAIGGGHPYSSFPRFFQPTNKNNVIDWGSNDIPFNFINQYNPQTKAG